MSGETPAESRILSQVREEMEAVDIGEPDRMTMDSAWDDIDIDSIDLIEIASAMEDRLSIEIDDPTLRTFKSVGDLVRAVAALELGQASGSQR